MKTKKVYNDLKEVLSKLGYKVTQDSGNFASGFCVIKEEGIVVINRNTPYENRVRVLSEFLSSIKTEDIYIKPYIRELMLSYGVTR